MERNGGSPRTLNLARSLVAECFNSHVECREHKLQPEGEPLLPTRLIDVGKSRDEIPRLCLSNGGRGKWVALSHCWGDRPFLKTTKSNIDEMQGGIKTSTLLATFQDAIAITKDLGVRFLWIDSLCIIQDSEEDWRNEAANMPEIYRNSYSQTIVTR